MLRTQHMLFQQQRNARRDGIAGLDHVLDEPLPVLALHKARRNRIHDCRATLVKAIEVDIARLEAAGIEQLLKVRRHLDQGEVVDLTTIHEELAVGSTQVLSPGSVAAEQRLAELPRSALAHPGRSGGITKQHGGIAIFGIDDLRVRICGDQQAVFQPGRFHEALHGIQAIDIARAAQRNIESCNVGAQAQLVLHDRSGMRQAFGVAVLGHNDHDIDGRRIKARVGRKQVSCCLHAKIRGFLGGLLARQEGRTDLAEDEILVLAEFRALRVIVDALDRYVTGDAFDANHCGFPIDMAKIRGLSRRVQIPRVKRRRDCPQTR